MEAKYKVGIMDDYRRSLITMLTPLLVFIILIAIFGFLLSNEIFQFEDVRFEITFPLFLIIVFTISIIVSKSTFSKEELSVATEHIESLRIGLVNFDSIEDYKSWTFRGATTYFIKIKEGKKIAIGPTSNFSTSADIVFKEFIKDFERSIKAFQKNEKIILDK
jgi:hypothetical protein